MGGKNSGRWPKKDYPGGRSQLSMEISKDLRNEFTNFCKENELTQPAAFEFLFDRYIKFNDKIEQFINDEPEGDE